VQLKPIPDSVPNSVWYRSKNRKEGKERNRLNVLKSGRRTQAQRKTWLWPGIA
jgi:hypothetical protein